MPYGACDKRKGEYGVSTSDTKSNLSGPEAIRRAIQDAEVIEFPERHGGGNWGPQDLELTHNARNDIGNAERLRARFGHDLLCVRGLGWHVWTGTHWELDGGEEAVKIRAQQTAVAIRREVKAIGANPPQDVGQKELDEMIEGHSKWAVCSGNSNRLTSMVTEARAHLTESSDVMDANPLLVNVKNGTLEIKGACETLVPHDRADRISKVIDVVYDPDATCPRFDAFLERVQPDASVRLFLQRWFGYCLTGLTHEQKLVFFFGEGANGKSVMVDVISRIMGAYSVSLPFTSLLRDDNKGGGDASPDLARLPGARFVRASEPEKGSRFSEAMIKAVTGGEQMTVRQLRKEFFDFVPQFKLTLSGNHKPRVMGQDHGIWRRLKLVPWPVIIPEREWDTELVHKLFAERSGIFNWMLDGARMYLEKGLCAPDAIEAATKEYRTDSDPLGQFVAGCVEFDPGARVQGADMFSAYVAFCRANGEQPWKQRTFGDGLSERGFKKDRVGGYVFYIGVRLVNVPTPHPGNDDPD